MPSRPRTRETERILFPATGFTLGDALDYYRKIAPILLPHLKGRPLSWRRFPGSVGDESFWEKDAPSFTPAWVRTVSVPRRSEPSDIHYLVVDDRRTLAWLVRAGGIELHPFLHRVPHLERPTGLVFDLDPGAGATMADCCRVALLLRDSLEGLGLRSLAKVSGSKGLQLSVPVSGAITHAMTEGFARVVADSLAHSHPKLVVSKMSKALRRRRVFIDWSQNAGYKTTVAVYSLRAKRDEPLVSMPVTWEEVASAVDDVEPPILEFEPSAALSRVARLGDLFAPLLTWKQHLPAAFVAAFGEVQKSSRPRPEPSEARGTTAATGSRSKTLPRKKSQSGRRLFVVPRTSAGSELWLDVRGRFRRWILRPERTGEARLIAVRTSGSWPVQEDYYRGIVPADEGDRVSIEDIGTYELVTGDLDRHRAVLFFEGKHLAGTWELEKISADPKHHSWSLAPVKEKQ
jgi:bifunctional non-homologous end joining protein LigD